MKAGGIHRAGVLQTISNYRERRLDTIGLI